MTGTTNPDRRAELWEMPDKRLFFMTPGTLKNDLAKGVRQSQPRISIGNLSLCFLSEASAVSMVDMHSSGVRRDCTVR